MKYFKTGGAVKTLRGALLAGLILCGLAFERAPDLNFAKTPPGPSSLSSRIKAQVAAPTKQEAAEQQPQDFDARCHAAGVLVCQGFDSPIIALPARWPASGLYPSGDNAIRGFFDRTQKTSGEGSLRFEIPPYTGANAAGYWRQSFGRNFGEGSTFYVQFRQRFSPEMLKNNWGDTTWKQVIFHNQGATCADVELTTGQYYHAGFPIMYTDCGSRMITTNSGNPPCKLEQGDYNCWYGSYNAKDCFIYPPNQWITFYYQVSIGHWGEPDSTINAWVGLDGKAMRQWIKMPNFILRNEHPGRDYDSLTLLTYMTNKDPSVNYPKAYTWYDELIISSQPIASPTDYVAH
jgi:hypothetical protein